MKRLVAALAAALACAALPLSAVFAQQSDDLLISPTVGDRGSRFQIVGVAGWTPGEVVVLRIGFTTGDPAAFTGAFPFEREVTVLRDGTWSFPVSVNDDLLAMPLGDAPGYVVVRATSPTNAAGGTFVYAPGGRIPTGAPPLAPFGSGPGARDAALWFALALFAAGTGALLAVSGRLRDIEAVRTRR